jgi:hypothetical protein
MSTFADEREAKEFAVQLILSEAEREGISLSELERKMLYFSETGWTIPNMTETAQDFENACDSGQYETKIKALTKRLRRRLQLHDRQTLQLWSAALQMLSEGDHYLLVLTNPNASSRRPPHDALKLCITALVIILIGGGVIALLPEHSAGPLAREKLAFWVWSFAALTVSLFLLLSLTVGRQRTNDLLAKIFREPPAKH